ncbi:hypothetical protein L21SP4_01614 [Kiritimatiella glycovorans]|uniref:Uncharacterized protein n=1 Tax=Kiritimatiella glycovorans TaxID=1307763 RepID=A0A0G3EHI2_9BACT|nr:hypothetical protein L21SP4_01614 [Kiritimatiella glycovorans]
MPRACPRRLGRHAACQALRSSRQSQAPPLCRCRAVGVRDGQARVHRQRQAASHCSFLRALLNVGRGKVRRWAAPLVLAPLGRGCAFRLRLGRRRRSGRPLACLARGSAKAGPASGVTLFDRRSFSRSHHHAFRQLPELPAVGGPVGRRLPAAPACEAGSESQSRRARREERHCGGQRLRRCFRRSRSHPDKPSGYLHGIRKPAGLLSGATRTGEDPRHFPSAVSLRRPFASPVLHAGQPRCKHSHHPRIPSLAPVRGHCGLSAAADEDAGVIRAEPQSPLRMHWRSPRRGTLRQTRLVFALHPSPPKTASPGSGRGCPAFRPVGRFSPVAAEPSLRKCRPKSRLQERLVLHRHPGSRVVAADFAKRPRPS